MAGRPRAWQFYARAEKLCASPHVTPLAVNERSRRRLIALTLVAAVALAIALLGIPYLSAFFKITLAGGAVLLFLRLSWKAFKTFLYKVGRRLAFSYFLLGVLPIPMVLLLLGFIAYVLAGFFLGHLYRDTVAELQAELDAAARSHVQTLVRTGKPPTVREPGIAFGYYHSGRRIAGDPRTPAAWPSWAGQGKPPERRLDREEAARFFAQSNGSPSLGTAAIEAGHGVLALTTTHLDREISRRADLWVETDRPDDPDLIGFAGRTITLRQFRREHQVGEAEQYFKRISGGERIWDDPVLWWAELTGPLLEPATGSRLSDQLTITLNSTPRTVLRHLFSTSGETDSKVWAALVLVAVLLLDIYVIAALMAVFMIVGLSLAVNRLSRATAAVREGDFSVRIPVRRRDQLGDLQRSFNEMSANLETLVATAAQKEVLEKELAIARDLQKSLIPTDLPAGQEIELATLFEPSAAIGGDYFDVLRLSETQLAVIIADVSGHGLPTGLRMAMLKAALLILVEETREPEEILRRLDGVVRNQKSRVFVTATLGMLDLRTGDLRLTNAGHPPTYLLRGGAVEEIVLPGSPLGGLGHTYGRATVTLKPGDVVVWLSDGLIEATDVHGEPFGYERVVQTFAAFNGTRPRAAQVRDSLLAAVERYAGGQPPNDDRTLVVMRYMGPREVAP